MTVDATDKVPPMPVRPRLKRVRRTEQAVPAAVAGHGASIAYDPDLVPPLERMRLEGIDVLEEWFRWGEEWSVLLRLLGRAGLSSDVLEIGCGQGRVAFPLRYVLSGGGSYRGFDIDRDKIAWLVEHFEARFPTFRFAHSDVRNTFYNPDGQVAPEAFAFPYPDDAFDLVFAASVFTHMAPAATERYFAESARVLRPGGRCVFSFFLLDFYDPERPRPLGFAHERFRFAHTQPEWGPDVAIAEPANPEQMTAYRLSLLTGYAATAGLRLADEPLPGLWSGASSRAVGAQDLLVLEHAASVA